MPYSDLRKGRISIIGQDYFVTFNTNQRKPYFQNDEAANILTDIIKRHDAIQCLAWVIMPDHVHLLFTLKCGTLANTIKLIKGRSSHEIGRSRIPFKWAASYYEHALRKEEDRIAIARYIVANPLRARLVKSLSDYPWWYAIYN